MKKYLPLLTAVICLEIIVIWQLFAKNTNFYIVALGILILSMLPLFVSFEKSRPSARQLALISSLIAIAVISRAVFYLVPQVKPIGAVVIVSGVCLGAKNGYIIGAFSAFISNFIFGQGMWTPFQMVAMGLIGMLSGLIFNKRAQRIPLSIVGFLLVFVVYGLVVDLNTVLMFTSDFSLGSVLAVYLAGVPFNLVFAASTEVFLLIFGEGFIKKINRITTKYAL